MNQRQEVKRCRLGSFRRQLGEVWGCLIPGLAAELFISEQYHNSHPPGPSSSQGLTTGCGLTFSRSCIWGPVKALPPTPLLSIMRPTLTTSCPKPFPAALALSTEPPVSALAVETELQRDRKGPLEEGLGTSAPRADHPTPNTRSAPAGGDPEIRGCSGHHRRMKTAANRSDPLGVPPGPTSLWQLPPPTCSLNAHPHLPTLPHCALLLPSIHLMRGGNESLER